MNDRAAPERLAARIMLGTDLDGPTCGEHGALVNPMHSGTKAMVALMHSWMGKTAEDIQLDSTKAMKALFMAVGWNASPAGALIYAMSKYCALHSDTGYSVGQKYVGYVEHTKTRLLGADGAEAAALVNSLELIGGADDLLSIKGSRAYVSAMNAPVVDRLLQPVEGSFLWFIEENKTLAKRKAPSRIADQISAGAHSPEIIACVRAEAIIGDFYLWPMLRAIKHRLPDGSDRHILDIGPVYQEAYKNLNYYARHPRLVVSGEATLLPSFAYAYVEHGPGMKSKGKRACADLERIYAAAGNNDKTMALITAALEKIASTLHIHTSELQPATWWAIRRRERDAGAQGAILRRQRDEHPCGASVRPGEVPPHARERQPIARAPGLGAVQVQQHARLGPAADAGQAEALHARRARGGGRHGEARGQQAAAAGAQLPGLWR